MVCLVRPAGMPVLPALATELGRDGQGRIPHVLIELPGPVLELDQATAPAPSDDDERKIQAVREILFDLAKRFRPLGAPLMDTEPRRCCTATNR